MPSDLAYIAFKYHCCKINNYTLQRGSQELYRIFMTNSESDMSHFVWFHVLFMAFYGFSWAEYPIDPFYKDDIKECVAAIFNVRWPSCRQAASQENNLWGICQMTNCEDQKSVIYRGGLDTVQVSLISSQRYSQRRSSLKVRHLSVLMTFLCLVLLLLSLSLICVGSLQEECSL